MQSSYRPVLGPGVKEFLMPRARFQLDSENSKGKSWQFPDEPKTIVFSLRQILSRQSAILHVTHDTDDGAWQFLEAQSPHESDGVATQLEYILEIDPTLNEIADLPLGFRAIRESVGAAWHVERNPFDGV